MGEGNDSASPCGIGGNYNAAMNFRFLPVALLLACSACTPNAPAPSADCRPVLEKAWIRAAPPGVPMLAGYAELRNDCATPVTIVGAESLDFASASIHETVIENDVSRMREVGPIDVPAHGRLVLEPGGRHLMLMDAARPFAEGEHARARLVLADGRRVFSEFQVRREAP
jgi:copper(I)-binding protein